jgi:hypothetical protein
LKRAVGFDKPAVFLIRDSEEAVLSWTIFRRQSLVDPALRSYVEYHRSLRSVAVDLFLVPFEAVLHRTPEDWNGDPKSFVWKKPADEIVSKAKRDRSTLASAKFPTHD